MIRFILAVLLALGLVAPTSASEYTQREYDTAIASVTARFSIALARERRVITAEQSQFIDAKEREIATLKRRLEAGENENQKLLAELSEARVQILEIADQLEIKLELDAAAISAFEDEVRRTNSEPSAVRLRALQWYGDGDIVAALDLLDDIRSAERAARQRANEVREATLAASDLRRDLSLAILARRTGDASALRVRGMMEELKTFDELSANEWERLASLRRSTGDPVAARDAMEAAYQATPSGSFERYLLLSNMREAEQLSRNGGYRSDYEIELSQRMVDLIVERRGEIDPDLEADFLSRAPDTETFNPDKIPELKELLEIPDAMPVGDQRWISVMIFHSQQVTSARRTQQPDHVVATHLGQATSILEDIVRLGQPRKVYLQHRTSLMLDQYLVQFQAAQPDELRDFLSQWEKDARELLAYDPGDIGLRDALGTVLRLRGDFDYDQEDFGVEAMARRSEALDISVDGWAAYPRSTPHEVGATDQIAANMVREPTNQNIAALEEIIAAVEPRLAAISEKSGHFEKANGRTVDDNIRDARAMMLAVLGNALVKAGQLSRAISSFEACIGLYNWRVPETGLIMNAHLSVAECQQGIAYAHILSDRPELSVALAQSAFLDAQRLYDQELPTELEGDPAFQKGRRAYVIMTVSILLLALVQNDEETWRSALYYLDQSEAAGFVDFEQMDDALRGPILQARAQYLSTQDQYFRGRDNRSEAADVD